jgi:hypothetical protein
MTKMVWNTSWSGLCQEGWRSPEAAKNKGQVLDLARVFFGAGNEIRMSLNEKHII